MAEKAYEAVRQTAEEKKQHEASEVKPSEPVAPQKSPEIVVRRNMTLGKSPLLGD